MTAQAVSLVRSKIGHHCFFPRRLKPALISPKTPKANRPIATIVNTS